MSSSKPAVPEPTHVGRFEIVQKLGAGAFGTVYKARDPELGRFVAVKTIRLEGLAASQSSLDDLLARFKREAQVAAQLKHPNIVTIHEIGSLPGNSYLVMEFVDGVGLDRVIARAGKMSVERAASIGAQVADALAYAQKHNVVHRDIKPANIMLEPGDRVKVTDFGIAKVTDSVDHLTATGSLLGTPSYMSPEQARGQKVDGRSDLFSVGCILYEMVAGQKAFRGESITALLFKILTEEPPPLRELDPSVSDEMLRIIGKALSKAPEKRYQTGRELADDLLAITRPGFVPTVRAAEVPTLPPDTPSGDVPTIASAPTVRPEPTIGSAATAGGPAASASTPPAPGTPPPLPPTVLTPATARVEPPSVPARPSPRAPQPLVPAPPVRRKGAGTGLLLALGLVGLVGLAAIVGGGWYLFGRRAATTEPSPGPVPAVETPAPSESTPAEAAAAVAAEATPTPDPAATTAGPGATEAPASGRVASASRPQPPPSTPEVPASATGSAPPAAASGTDYSYLDQLPPEPADGRAAGEALAQKYRSGGSSGYTSTRFRQRPLFPPGTTPTERPAIGTLLHLHQAEEAFHRKNGRYGNPRELAEAGYLRLDVPVSVEGFRRARYGFRVAAGADAYRADAVPLAGTGRAFMVDDSGFVRLPDE